MDREVIGYVLTEAHYVLDGFELHVARRGGSETPFLLKTSSSDFPPLSDVQRLEHELSILRDAGAPAHALRPLERLDDNKRTYLVFEWFAGRPLAKLTSLEDALRVAVQLLRALEASASHGIIHGRLTPTCILYDRANDSLRLTHFVQARSREHPKPPVAEAETIGVFSAPEQTGESSAAIDHRTDLYSAGAVLYYLLAGVAPVADALGVSLRHSLVATEPRHLRELRSELPERLCSLVMRLLAKSPRERPASALEALDELRAIQRERATGTGGRSAPPQFGSPRARGREFERARLDALARDASGGVPRIVVVAGAPGSGKSTLVEDFRAAAGRAGKLTASGKFEQYRQGQPYVALLAAMDELFGHVLAGPESALEALRDDLESIDPELRGVLAEHIATFAPLAAPEAAPARLGPAETQNRFHQAFRALLGVLCRPEHALILVIDDLQWSDHETVALLTELFVKVQTPYMLLVVALRPQEAAKSSEVSSLLAALEGLPDVLSRIDLDDLPDLAIAALCDDIASPCRDAARLHALVQQGCHGNPLFAIEILKRLQRTGQLHWIAEAGGTWALRAESRSEPLPTGSVVDFIVGRIDALPAASRHTLIAAACVGHHPTLADLKFACELSDDALADALRAACREGLLVPDSAGAEAWLEGGSGSQGLGASVGFSFCHDRVQQAAHGMCSESERKRLHLLVGRGQLAGIGNRPVTLFSAVEHLNEAPDLLEADERLRLAELNLEAGKRAKEIAAYRSASELFTRALALLDEYEATRVRRLRFECELALAESLYLSIDLKQEKTLSEHDGLKRAESLFTAALGRASDTAEQVLVHRTQLVLDQHLQRYKEALERGLPALRLLGTRLRRRPIPPRVLTALGATLWRVRGLRTDELMDRPDTASEKERVVLDLLVLAWTPSFWIDELLNGLVVLRLVNMTLDLGNTPQAPMAYATFGILFHVLLKRHARGREFGQLAMRLLGDDPEPFIASRVRFLVLTFFGAFERDNRANVDAYRDALAKCLATGEHVFAGHTIDGIVTSLPIHGFRIPDVQQRLDGYAVTARQIGAESSLELIGIVRAWCRALSVHPEAEGASIPVESIFYKSYVGVHGLLGMIVAYLWNADELVLRTATDLEKNIVVQSNPLHAATFALFYVLAAARSRGGTKRRMRNLVGRLRRFEVIYPGNFRSMALLARAEEAALTGGAPAALALYHEAIGEAAARGHDLVHAIACERLAHWYETQARDEQHREYLQIAVYSYDRFGATAKAEQLSARHPSLSPRRAPSVTDSTRGSVDMRAEAVMRAAYAIAEETQSDRLSEGLLRVITTTAGGQRAFLVKQGPSGLMLVAGWEVERANAGFEPEPVERSSRVSQGVILYVVRTKSAVHVHDARRDARFSTDVYLQERAPRSVLCVPLLHRGELLAVLYLENSVCADVFTDDQRKLATMLGHQAAIAMAIADYHRVQIEALQARINPHFLYNALSVITGLVKTAPDKAEAAVLKLSKLYRYVLNSSADQVVTLEQELAIVRDYLALEQYRFEDKLNVEIDVRGPIGEVELPALLLQPLVENGVRHGVARKVGAGTIRVEVSVEGATCRMLVRDDGPGWGSERLGSGFGLRSVRERLRLLYQDQFELNIVNAQGVSIEVRIPSRVSAAQRSGATQESHKPSPEREDPP